MLSLLCELEGNKVTVKLYEEEATLEEIEILGGVLCDLPEKQKNEPFVKSILDDIRKLWVAKKDKEGKDDQCNCADCTLQRELVSMVRKMAEKIKSGEWNLIATTSDDSGPPPPEVAKELENIQKKQAQPRIKGKFAKKPTKKVVDKSTAITSVKSTRKATTPRKAVKK